MGIYFTFFLQAGTATAGQVAVINPSSGGGIAIASTVSVPTVASTITPPTATVNVPTATVVSTPTATVSTPTATVSTPTATVSATSTTVTTPEAAGTLTRVVSALTNSTTNVTPEAGASAASASSENSTGGSETASSPSSVSGYAPQLVATIQSVNVSVFTPQQANTLISIIEAQISQPGTPASVRQALAVEKARLAVIASN